MTLHCMAFTRAIDRASQLLPSHSSVFYHVRACFLTPSTASLLFNRNKISSAVCGSLYTDNDDTGFSNPRVVPQSTINAMIEEIYGELAVQSIQGRSCSSATACKSIEEKFDVWAMVFTNPKLPLSVDIGSGSGRFLMLLAKRNSGSSNFLGLDVRHKLVERSNAWAEQLQLKNMHFITANATIALDSLLATYPGKLTFVSILCPDPQFKTRHYKRRIVQRPLVNAIMKYLAVGGKIFLESDVEEVVLDMKRHFKEHLGDSLVLVKKHESTSIEEKEWYPENPTGVPTEREVAVLGRGLPMFRLLYERV
ncbi:hypothetical protein O6H91_09G022600 [Diphasiastrum complanatum]|uniref:Uncharacterized protein n=1 Tax=Diphasiastrum complanatum TaxID=34168 RepID=A0ACC2CLZ7_DIPCM|nr:hypothetical protein O6H91_09G022600 [Diphasiastrum complanatum]